MQLRQRGLGCSAPMAWARQRSTPFRRFGANKPWGRGVTKSRSDARARGGNDRKVPLLFLLFVLGWTPRDAVAFVLGTAAVVAIVVNVLFMQLGSHPAPLWMPAKVEKATQSAAKPAQFEPLPRVDTVPAPVTPKLLVPHALRTPKEIITDIQRELARRGYYDGRVDGLYGPRTDGAIRDFEQATGLKPSAQEDRPWPSHPITRPWGLVPHIRPMTNSISQKADGRDSWENLRNLLKRNGPILHQLGKKPRKIKSVQWTHAPQQRASSFDNSVSALLKEQRHVEAERLRGLKVDH
jgi:peptidoglycan hydrolase-like protein with peptidoglycan-binding domain